MQNLVEGVGVEAVVVEVGVVVEVEQIQLLAWRKYLVEEVEENLSLNESAPVL